MNNPHSISQIRNKNSKSHVSSNGKSSSITNDSASLTKSISPQKTTSQVNKGKLDEETKKSIEEIGNQLIDKQYVPNIPSNLVSNIYDYLQKKKQEILNQHRFDLAQEVEDISKELLQSRSEAIYDSNLLNTRLNLKRRLDAAEEELEKGLLLKEKERQLLYEEKEAEIDQLLQEHEEKLRKFDDDHSEENIPSSFQKSSQRLLNLQYQKKQMIKAKKFAEASQIQFEADQLEILEKQEQIQKWTEFSFSKRQNLLKELQNELKCLEIKWDRKITKFERIASEQETLLQNAVQSAKIRYEKSLQVPDSQAPSNYTRMRTKSYSIERNKEIMFQLEAQQQKEISAAETSQ